MTKILLGPAGSPAKSTLEGVSKVKELGLQAMEIQFTHGIKMGLDLAKQIGEANRKLGVKLSIHAPYYINLFSEDREKARASRQRILDSCERAHLIGASPVVFHAGYYGKRSKEDTYAMMLEEMEEMMKFVKEKRLNVEIAPEIGGKHSAFGSLEELISLVKKLKCSLCVDLAHLYARNNGNIDYAEILDKLRVLHLPHYHFHFSGIKYSEKGEVSHLVIDHNPDFTAFAKELLNKRVECTIISESPVTWKDSLKMKAIFEKLGHEF